MRKFRLLAILLLVSMIVVPYFTVLVFRGRDEAAPDTENTEKNDIFDMDITVYMTKPKKVKTIRCYDYICGVVAGEMQANYSPEALKAQAVAAFTYTVNKMNYVISNPDIDIGHNGAYVCDDYNHCKAYLDKADAKKKWGSEWFNKYYPNIESAVTECLGKIITYNGAPINAVFHSLSNGKTCSADEVWGTEVPYLQSVECACDKKAEEYESRAVFSHDEFSEILYTQLGVVLTDDYKSWLGDIKKCDSGMVDEISLGGTSYPGTLVRKLFSLKSSTFTVEITDKEVIFKVFGYGHGVGMSQYGANEMAKNGSTYEEILKYFYKDVEIEDYTP